MLRILGYDDLSDYVQQLGKDIITSIDSNKQLIMWN